MNGQNGIVPTIDLATNNQYPYPVMYGNGYGNNGIFGGDGIWAIVLLAAVILWLSINSLFPKIGGIICELVDETKSNMTDKEEKEKEE